MGWEKLQLSLVNVYTCEVAIIMLQDAQLGICKNS